MDFRQVGSGEASTGVGIGHLPRGLLIQRGPELSEVPPLAKEPYLLSQVKQILGGDPCDIRVAAMQQ